MLESENGSSNGTKYVIFKYYIFRLHNFNKVKWSTTDYSPESWNSFRYLS